MNSWEIAAAFFTGAFCGTLWGGMITAWFLLRHPFGL
jgi:hypothetical protein